MRKVLVLLVVLAAVIAVVLLWPQQQQQPAPDGGTGIPEAATAAVIEYVHDGDTLFLEDGRKVRLLGIDTPEIGERAECYGDEAAALLRELLPEGAEVWVLPDVEPLDQYGRSLLFIYTEDAINVNLVMLERGAAEVEQYAPNLMLRDELELVQRQARERDVGMWGEC